MAVWSHLYANIINQKYHLLILKGLANTLEITVCSLIMSLFLGMLIATIRAYYQVSGKFRFLNYVVVLFVNVIRGTPVMLQLLMMAYVIFVRLKSTFLVAVITFGLNSCAYVSEVLRSGIKGVPASQYAAGTALGFKNYQIIKWIIFPQAFRNSLPSLLNEFSALLKESAIVGIIGVTDLTHAASIIRGALFAPVVPLLTVGIIYLLIISIVSYYFEKIELAIKSHELASSKRIYNPLKKGEIKND